LISLKDAAKALDAAHRAVVQAFKVPERDRYQIVHENKAHHMIIEDTGLGLTRSREVVVVRVYTSPRSEEQSSFFMPPCRLSSRSTAG
jgi:hypothetical protein